MSTMLEKGLVDWKTECEESGFRDETEARTVYTSGTIRDPEKGHIVICDRPTAHLCRNPLNPLRIAEYHLKSKISQAKL